jgi:hypothetical protein
MITTKAGGCVMIAASLTCAAGARITVATS